jgi:malate synthase
VRADKEREVRDGHDGTWVAHPGLVPLARAIFDRGMPAPNQIDRRRDDVVTREEDLLVPPQGTRTEAGLRRAVVVGLRYLDAWLSGLGCVPLDHLMEDAATAEICRTQIWQWVRHGARLDDGRVVDAPLVRSLLAEETASLKLRPDTVPLFEQVALSEPLIDFLTLPAYERLVALEPASP